VNKPTPRLYKTIFLAQFRPQLSYFNQFRPAAGKLNGYPQWRTDSNSITLRDYQSRCSLVITHNSIGFSQDSDDITTASSRLKEALQVLPNELTIQNFLRLGFRRQYLASFEASFEELVRILGVKLLSQKEALIRLLPSNTTDLLYRVDLKDAENMYHLTVGPLRRQEIPNWIQFEAENHLAPDVRQEQYLSIVASYPDVATLIDIDVFRADSTISTSDSVPFIEMGERKTAELARSLNEYLFSADVMTNGSH
jgi:hypothetical protein